MKTADIRLSGTGKLMGMPWLEPGLRLSYN